MKTNVQSRMSQTLAVVRLVLASVVMPAVCVCAVAAQEPWTSVLVVPCRQPVGMVNRMIVDDGDLLAATTSCGPMVSTDGGRRWEPHPAGPVVDSATREPLAMYSIARWNGLLWGAFGNHGVFVYRDGVWMHVPGIPPNTIVRALDRDSNTGVIYAGTQGGGLYAFDSTRVTFERMPEISPFDPITVNVFANTRRGFVMGTSLHGLQTIRGDSAVYHSDNRGFPFEPISTHAIVESQSGWQVSNTLPFAVAGGMYVRGPASDVWKVFNDGIDKYLAFAFDIVAAGEYFILSTGYKAALGVYVWAPPQLEWRPWNQGLLDLEVSALAVVRDHSGARTIVAGTRSGAVFVRPAPEAGTRVEPEMDAPTTTGAVIHRNQLMPLNSGARLYDVRGCQIDPAAATSGIAILVANGTRTLVYLID